MAYTIKGLDPAAFADTDALIAAGAIRMTVDQPNAFPCRVSLEDAAPGAEVLLLNFVSANAPTPFRASHAIYIQEGAVEAPLYKDEAPPFLARRTTSLRGFDRAGMIRAARLAQPGEADAGLRGLFEDAEIVHVDIHAAAWGCFLARAERDDA